MPATACWMYEAGAFSACLTLYGPNMQMTPLTLSFCDRCVCLAQLCVRDGRDAGMQAIMSILPVFGAISLTQNKAAAPKAVLAVTAAVVANGCLHTLSSLKYVLSITLSSISKLSASTTLQQQHSCTHNTAAPCLAANAQMFCCFCMSLQSTEARIDHK